MLPFVKSSVFSCIYSDVFCCKFCYKTPTCRLGSEQTKPFAANNSYLGNSFFSFLDTRKRSLGLTKLSKPITVSSSKCNRTRVCSAMEGQTQLVFSSSRIGSPMEGQTQLVFSSSETDKYSKELEVAVRAVQMACLLCSQIVPERFFPKTNGEIHSNDDSPVTIADWSVQAVVSWALAESFGSDNTSILAEEHAEPLSKANAAGLLEAVVKTVNNCLAEAPQFGFKTPLISLGTSDVLEAISRCNSTGGPIGRFWVLSPVFGTSSFVGADQHAVSLALIEDGKVVIGVLGCPNYPMKKEWPSYPTSESWKRGCVSYARRGSGKAWVQPLPCGEKKLLWPNNARQTQVSSIDDPAFATFCEPVNKANSSHSLTTGSAHKVGLINQPLCENSMVKYAGIGCGHAEVFMKYARTGCKEKIWDHAAGGVIIQEAGGVVTDIGGHPLDFSKGLYLEGLDRGVIACAGAKLHEKIIGAIDSSWNSSCL